jgi:hypothetical protein
LTENFTRWADPQGFPEKKDDELVINDTTFQTNMA